MTINLAGRLAALKLIPRSRSVPAGLALLLLIAFILWVMPRRLDRIVSADGRYEWVAGQGPAPRQVLWEPAQLVEGLFPEGQGQGSLITPRLADGGATLYFTFRP